MKKLFKKVLGSLALAGTLLTGGSLLNQAIATDIVLDNAPAIVTETALAEYDYSKFPEDVIIRGNEVEFPDGHIEYAPLKETPAPVIETPKVEEKITEQPKVETQKVEEPKVDSEIVTPVVEKDTKEEKKVENKTTETVTKEEPGMPEVITDTIITWTSPELPKVEEPKVQPTPETKEVPAPKPTPVVEEKVVEPKVELPKVEEPKVQPTPEIKEVPAPKSTPVVEEKVVEPKKEEATIAPQPVVEKITTPVVTNNTKPVVSPLLKTGKLADTGIATNSATATLTTLFGLLVALVAKRKNI